MTLLITTHSITKSYGTHDLFKDLTFTISQGDQIGVVGPNGAGKSTLLKILAGLDKPNSGFLTLKKNIRVGFAGQSPEFEDLPLEEILVKDIHHHKDDALTRARILLSRTGFTDSMRSAKELSGGWKKRLDIARALMSQPDLLLLDEPTNHLDLEGILWLESFLKSERLTYMVISHDRYFLENVSNKILELNRCFPGGMFLSSGPYSTFMERKEAFLAGQAHQQRAVAGQVRNEVDWLRRSPKARTTKSVSRIQRAYALIDDLHQLEQRNKTEVARVEFNASERETRKLLTGKNLGKSMGGKVLFKGVDLVLSPGTRLGITGANGTGKTTLLKILAGEVKQDMGTVKYADDLKLVYFDQHRETISGKLTLKEALSPHSDYVTYNGQNIHVNGWARRFLFSPDRLLLPVEYLSGGERARIQIAKLMLQPADILFLDEPTNDLDIPTLEVIEESLCEFPGAVVLISHDRCLMDSICNETVDLGDGLEKKEEVAKPKTVIPEPKKAPAPKKLSYKDQKDLETLPGRIEKMETEIGELQVQLDSEEVGKDAQRALELYRKMGEMQAQLESLYARWQSLENM